jgi:transposase InsO family protein
MLPTEKLYTEIKEGSKFLRDPSLRWKIECLLRGLKGGNVTLACSQAGIHRSTFYRWLTRLSDSDFESEALRSKSCRPHFHPKTISGNLGKRIVWFRETFHYGSDRIAWYLTQEGLSVSSHGVYNVLKREQIPFRRRRDQKPNVHRKRYELDLPGQGLQLDIKYVPFPIERKKAYVFNAIDDCSRWRFQWAYRNKGIEQACDFVLRLVAATPFHIEQIQTDNDVAFTNLFLRTPSETEPEPHPFPALLQSQQIRHKLIPPGVKELNGKVERSHKTDDQEFYWILPPWISFEQFQLELSRWTFEYNHYRPHGSLKMKTPTQRLQERGILVSSDSPGIWTQPKKPSHYAYIVEKLRNERRNNSTDLIHWKFKPNNPTQLRINPTWLPGTPWAIKALSQMYGKTTLFREHGTAH